MVKSITWFGYINAYAKILWYMHVGFWRLDIIFSMKNNVLVSYFREDLESL